MNSSIMVHLDQAGSLDVLVFVGEVRVQAGLHTNCILLHEEMWRAWSSELSSLFGMWRTTSSRSFLSFGVRIVGAGSELDAGVSGAGRRAVLPAAAAVLLAEWRACGSW